MASQGVAGGGEDGAPVRAGDRIRAAARDLFYRRGIRAVGVDEIVARAGVTKPSLYRGFASKDALAVACLEDFAAAFARRLDTALAAHPGDARAGLMAFLADLADRTARPDYRGCGLSNAVIEHPEPDHPARRAALASKRALRARLEAVARDLGARQPDVLADGLLLLIEGAFAAGQIFGAGGPARSLTRTADALVAASLAG
ncbi:transcriptional regulator, TetR family [Methylobacterium sp. 4-46]|uniref:TetR/AcrR family transcriptional regulator n=1 Tax=unclassified Methylobacterium TaxID=2615210 RepID=UPI000165C5E9|nr:MULTISPECIES: TetR/AcrR family transcriptional regulator [Methylobacterium]ACA16759.1 transcriptional regulator, TetR family [Methylobacterium sp. 4-46]WFT82455.1 TetR/AcrR family transcriptional regulator [Methylobacterium nodulans]